MRAPTIISTFAAHLTHELKSPLTSIKGAGRAVCWICSSSRTALSPSGAKEDFLANILGDTERLEAMAHRLRGPPAPSSPARRQRRLAPVMADLRRRFPGKHRHRGHAAAWSAAIGMSAENALIVLSHLVDNASAITPPRSTSAPREAVGGDLH